METTIVFCTRIIVCVVEVLMLHMYFNYFYTIRQNKVVVWIGYSIYGVVLWVLGAADNAYLSLLGTVVLSTLILFSIYNGKITEKILSLASYFVILVAADVIAYFIFTLFGDNSMSVFTETQIESVPIVIIGKSLQFSMINIFFRFKKSDGKLIFKDFIVLLSLNIISLVISLSMLYFDQMERQTRIITCIFIGCAVLILSITLFYFFQRSKRIDEYEKEKEILECRLNVQAESFEEIKNMQENLRLIWHDIKNHMDCMKHMADMNSEQTLEYMSEFQKRMEKFSPLNDLGNDVVDAILYSKSMKAEAEGIYLDISMNISRKLKINPIDMCSILSNVLDNAIEATKLADKDKVIKLSAIQNYRFVLITIVNPTIEKPRIDRKGNFITSKKDRKIHGLGMKSVQAVLDKYMGNINSRYENGHFYLNILLCV